MQIPNAVTANFSSEQLPPSGFADQCWCGPSDWCPRMDSRRETLLRRWADSSRHRLSVGSMSHRSWLVTYSLTRLLDPHIASFLEKQCGTSKHKTFVWHLYNVGSTAKTLGRRFTNVIQMFCVCWVTSNKLFFPWEPLSGRSLTTYRNRPFWYKNGISATLQDGRDDVLIERELINSSAPKLPYSSGD